MGGEVVMRMRGRRGVRKALVGGAVLVVVGLLLLFAGGVPLIPGRGPTTSDPVGLPPDGPLADLDAFQFRLSPSDLEGDGLDAPVGPPDPAPVHDVMVYVDAGVGRGDGVLELDRDVDEARSEPAGPMRSTDGALAAVLLGLIVLKAALDQDRDRRRRTPAPFPAPASTSAA